MFLGYTENAMDLKGRVSVPAKYRKKVTNIAKQAAIAEGQLADSGSDDDWCAEVIVTLGYDDAVRVYTEAEYSDYIDSLFSNEVNGNARYNHFDEAERRMNSQLMMYTAKSPIDTAGRITIPANIRKRAGLGRRVLIIGKREYLEIWDPDRNARFLDGESVGGLVNDLVAARMARLAAAQEATASQGTQA